MMKKRIVSIPSAQGTYVVLLGLTTSRSIAVGKLGWIDFLPGWYAYAGSALGPGGLAARVGRHIQRRKKKHWHIDYLRPATRMEGVVIAADSHRWEHQWARSLGDPPLSGEPVNGFGATDCGCDAHLYYFGQRPEGEIMASALRAQWIPLAGGIKNQ